MVIVDVVLETYDAVGFTAWPIAQPSADRLLTLSGRLSSPEVGTAMAVVFTYNDIPVGDDLTAPQLEDHLAETGGLIAPGGLRFRDTATNVHVTTGCCFGLENWRDWQDLAHGYAPWLGHDPELLAEHHDHAIRLRQDRHRDHPPAAVEITRTDIPALLTSAQRQLSGFLDLVHAWTAHTAPGLAGTLIGALDRNLRINEQ
ncbi:hypothetical protein [Nonomuraea typhae]|uniref:hypothetical protein n=1 Tax=Nonomuraea typhae TaxID=2603600 RepID=UPI0012FA54B9|nr:hypothetical protein [Nonomuraea typhae]